MVFEVDLPVAAVRRRELRLDLPVTLEREAVGRLVLRERVRARALSVLAVSAVVHVLGGSRNVSRVVDPTSGVSSSTSVAAGSFTDGSASFNSSRIMDSVAA